MRINREMFELEVKCLERDVKKKVRGVSNESKSSLLDRVTLSIADLQLISPHLTIDKNSSDFKRISNIYSTIQGKIRQ